MVPEVLDVLLQRAREKSEVETAGHSKMCCLVLHVARPCNKKTFQRSLMKELKHCSRSRMKQELPEESDEGAQALQYLMQQGEDLPEESDGGA